MTDEGALYPVRNPELVWRLVDDELVIVRPSDGQIRVLNDVGSFVWQALDGCREVSDLARLVCDEYQVSLEEAADDIQLFLAPLVEDGMVQWTRLGE
jgi:hypothetical protein